MCSNLLHIMSCDHLSLHFYQMTTVIQTDNKCNGLAVKNHLLLQLCILINEHYVEKPLTHSDYDICTLFTLA